MKKLKSTLPNMFFSLTLICIVAAAILASVNEITAGPIASTKQAALEAAIKAVTPKYDNNPVQEATSIVAADGDSLRLYPAKLGDSFVGVAIETRAIGYGGEMTILVGFDGKGTLVNYSILQHSETPGLGARAEKWFRTDKNKQRVIGRSMEKGSLTVTKDGGDVDAITAATITSRAFLKAINKAYNAYAKREADADSGATLQDTNIFSSARKEGGIK